MTENAQKKRIFIRRAWLALVILVLSVLQNVDGLFPQVLGARALLLIPAVTAIAMYERDMAGMFFGLFAGALWDVFALGNNFNAIYLFIVGFACGALINTIMRNNIVTHFILSSAATVIYCLGYWLYHYVITNLDEAVLMLLKYFVPDTIYTIVLTPLIFAIIKAVEKKFRTDEYSLI